MLIGLMWVGGTGTCVQSLLALAALCPGERVTVSSSALAAVHLLCLHGSGC